MTHDRNKRVHNTLGIFKLKQEFYVTSYFIQLPGRQGALGGKFALPLIADPRAELPRDSSLNNNESCGMPRCLLMEYIKND